VLVQFSWTGGIFRLAQPYPGNSVRDLNITELKKTEEALRDSKLRFLIVFRSRPMGIGISSLSDDRFIDVKQSFSGCL
jgi:PAS domain-containing protein